MSEDDLSYDELSYEEAPAEVGPVLSGLAVLLIAVLGAPQVWEALRSGGFAPALVFYPVLAAACGYLAVQRSR
jgi:hypothetical protein